MVAIAGMAQAETAARLNLSYIFVSHAKKLNEYKIIVRCRF